MDFTYSVHLSNLVPPVLGYGLTWLWKTIKYRCTTFCNPLIFCNFSVFFSIFNWHKKHCMDEREIELRGKEFALVQISRKSATRYCMGLFFLNLHSRQHVLPVPQNLSLRRLPCLRMTGCSTNQAPSGTFTYFSKADEGPQHSTFPGELYQIIDRKNP